MTLFHKSIPLTILCVYSAQPAVVLAWKHGLYTAIIHKIPDQNTSTAAEENSQQIHDPARNQSRAQH